PFEEHGRPGCWQWRRRSRAISHRTVATFPLRRRKDRVRTARHVLRDYASGGDAPVPHSLLLSLDVLLHVPPSRRGNHIDEEALSRQGLPRAGHSVASYGRRVLRLHQPIPTCTSDRLRELRAADFGDCEL